MYAKCKVTILGNQKDKKKNLNPIKFLYYDSGSKNNNRDYATVAPRKYKFIELISRGFSNFSYDIMFAYNDSRKDGNIYFGEFNDGVVDEDE